MAYAINFYTANGTQTTYSVTFPYISQSNVVVQLDGVVKTLGTDYTFPTSSTITFTTAPTNGVIVKFTRNSNRAARLVDYQDGSTITESILDQDSNQMFFMAQEAIDITEGVISLNDQDQWDGLNKQLVNIADPTANHHVGTKGWIENTWLSSSDKATIANLNANLPAINTSNTNLSFTTTVANNTTNINTVAGQISPVNNIQTLANQNANLTTLAGVSDKITTVADNISKVNQVYTDILKVVEVANDLQEATSEIEVVANNINNVNLVGNDINNVNDIGNNINAVLAVNTNEPNINAVVANESNINAVKNNETNINAVFANANNINSAVANESNINQAVANESNINVVSTNIGNVNIVGNNIGSVNDFAEKYRISATQPTTSLDIGDLWYDSVNQKLSIYTTSGWQTASDYVSALINRYHYTATNGQVVFTGADDFGLNLSFTTEANAFVFLNGIRIIKDQDYTLTNGNTLTLSVAANTGDLIYVEVVAKISITEEAVLQGYVASALADKNTATAQAAIATTQAQLATTNGATQVQLAADQVALATIQAGLATTNGATQVSLAADQVALATTQANLATTNGQTQLALTTAQAVIATDQATISTTQANTAIAQAVISTTQAGIATTKASEADASASAAAVSALAAAAAAGGGAVAITSADTTADVLNNKIVVSGQLTKTILNAGANEQIELGVVVVFDESNQTATNGQTVFNISYTVNYIQVFVNGIKIINGQDFTATNGTSVVLSQSCVAGDIVEFVKFK